MKKKNCRDSGEPVCREIKTVCREERKLWLLGGILGEPMTKTRSEAEILGEPMTKTRSEAPFGPTNISKIARKALV